MSDFTNRGEAADCFAVVTNPRQEMVVALNLENQGFDVFLPQMRRTVRHARKVVARKVPVFLGYRFLRASLAMRWWSVNGTFGVVRIITNDQVPALVQRGFVNALGARAGVDGFMDFSDDLQPGAELN